jgi:hypothetical protein
MKILFVILISTLISFLIPSNSSAETNLWCKMTDEIMGMQIMRTEDTEEYASIVIKDNFKKERRSETIYGKICVRSIKVELTSIYDNSNAELYCYNRASRDDDSYNWTLPERVNSLYDYVASYSVARDTLKYMALLDPMGSRYTKNYQCEITEGNIKKINSLISKQKEISNKLKDEQKKKNKF